MSDEMTQEVEEVTAADPSQVRRERFQAAQAERQRLLQEEHDEEQRRLREEGARRIARETLCDE